MKKILKLAINSQTARVVYSGECVDYHVDDGYSSSLLIDFINGRSVSFTGYKSKKVKMTDDFSWKSPTDNIKPKKYVSIKTGAERAIKIGGDIRKRIQSSRSMFHPVYVVSKRYNPPPKDNTIDENNKKNYGKLFGGKS